MLNDNIRSYVLQCKYICVALLLIIGISGCGEVSSVYSGNNLNKFNYEEYWKLRNGGTITISDGMVEAWNPLSSIGDQSRDIMSFALPSLFLIEPNLNIILNKYLLESYTTSYTDDGHVKIIYKLKSNAKWSNGDPIDVEDMIYSWMLQNGSNKNLLVSRTDGYSDITSITKGDTEHEAVVIFDKPYIDWKSLFTNLLPSRYLKSLNMNDEYLFNTYLNESPLKISGGPFQIYDLSANKKIIVLKRNDNWYGRRPKLDKIVFRTLTGPSTAVAALSAHDINALVVEPQLDLLSQLKHIKNIKIEIASSMLIEHLDINTHNSYLNHDLREAIMLSINRESMVDKLLKPFDKDGSVANNRFYSINSKYYKDTVGNIGYGDYKKSINLLISKGYRYINKKLYLSSGEKFPTLRLRYPNEDQFRGNIMTIVQRNLNDIGIDAEIIPTDSIYKTMSNIDEAHSYDILSYAYIVTPFPATKGSSFFRTGVPANYNNISNSDIDSNLDQALNTIDYNLSADKLNSADKYITDQYANLPLFDKAVIFAVDNRFANIRRSYTTYNPEEWGMRN